MILPFLQEEYAVQRLKGAFRPAVHAEISFPDPLWQKPFRHLAHREFVF
jgi:hypothetical protein